MSYTFDGTNKRIVLGTATLVLADLWSRWKEWVLAGNAQFLPALDTVGGDIAAIPLYLFPKNGWKIVPQAADHVLRVTGGVLATEDDSDPFVDPVGSYKIRINREAPAIAIGYSTSGGSGLSTDQANRLARIEKFLRNKRITDPVTGRQTVYDDDDSTVLGEGALFEDAAGSQAYRGQGAERAERLA